MGSEIISSSKKGYPILMAISLVFGTMAVLVSFFLFNYNKNLQHEIQLRDSLIVSIQKGDSAYKASIKDYSDVITRYVSNCSFTINDKTVSPEELINLLNMTLEENGMLSDSLAYLKELSAFHKDVSNQYKKKMNSIYDSADINRHVVQYFKNEYGLSYKIIKKDSVFIFKKVITTVDSALAIFPYYKDKLKLDTVKMVWIITTPSKQVIQGTERRKKRNKKN